MQNTVAQTEGGALRGGALSRPQDHAQNDAALRPQKKNLSSGSFSRPTLLGGVLIAATLYVHREIRTERHTDICISELLKTLHDA